MTFPFILSATIYGSTLNVPAPYATIQSAIDAAAGGDTVLVASGLYFENISYRGKGITVASHFILNSDPSFIYSTVIDGSQPAHADTASCVLITRPNNSTASDTSAALIGFTIRNGTGTRWLDEHGAGYYREGGGILTQYISPRIKHNLIIDNSATSTAGCTSAGGGGIRCGDGNPRIMNNVILRNTALYGPGIVINYCGGIIRNNIIHRNTGGSAYYGGSAIWANSDGPSQKTIENNTLISNTAAVSNGTGGILMWATSCALKNNLLWDNTPTQMRTAGGGSFAASYNTVQGGFAGTGNLSLNPRFADSCSFLSDLSPCIDAGDSVAAYNDPEHPSAPGFAEWPSGGTLRNDQGAYGGPGRTELPSFSGAWFQLSTLLINFGTVQQYDSVTGKIILANKGVNPLFVDSVVIKNHTAGVSVQNLLPCTFSPLWTDTIFILWKPVSAAPLEDTVLIYHSDTSTVSPQMTRITGTVTPVGIPDHHGKPYRFALGQNYPNPFNPSTTIEYSVPRTAKVSLIVYNLLGQPVAVLAEGLRVPGIYKAEWNGKNDKIQSVSTGVYLYRLKVNDEVLTRKMILIR